MKINKAIQLINRPFKILIFNNNTQGRSKKHEFFNFTANFYTSNVFEKSALLKLSNLKTLSTMYNNKKNLYFNLNKNFFGAKKDKKEEHHEDGQKIKETDLDLEKKENNSDDNLESKEKGRHSEKKDAKNSENDHQTVKKVEYDHLNTLYRESEESLSKARTKFDELRKAYLEMQSDIDRIRKRSETDVANAKDFAITKFAKDMLDVYDNFYRALELIKNLENKQTEDNKVASVEQLGVDEELKHKIQVYSDFTDGILMTKDSLNRIFNFHGVKEYNPIKEKFDPNKHEAISQIPSTDLPPGTIAYVMQTGFMIGNRILRPAKVAVVKK